MKMNDLPEFAVQTLRPLTIDLFAATARGSTAQAAFEAALQGDCLIARSGVWPGADRVRLAALRWPACLRAHRRRVCVRAVVM